MGDSSNPQYGVANKMSERRQQPTIDVSQIDSVRECNELRAPILEEMEQLVRSAGPEGLSPEQEERFEKCEADENALRVHGDKLDKRDRIAAARASMDQQRREGDTAPSNGVPASNQNDQPEDRESYRDRQNRSMISWLSGGKISRNGKKVSSHEEMREFGFDPSSSEITLRWDPVTDEFGVRPNTVRGVLDAYERRAQSVGTATEGGHTAPDEMMRPIDIALLQFGGVRQVATVITTDTGNPLPIPTTNDTSQVGEIIAENAAVNTQDIVFGQLVLNSFLFSSKEVAVSIQLMQDSDTNMPNLVGRLLGERIGRIQNQMFTTGTGTGQPNGVVTAAADSSVTMAGANPTFAEWLDIAHSVDIAYRSNASWMFNDSVLLSAKKLVSTDGVPLFLSGVAGGTPDRIADHPYVVNNDMPTGSSAKSVVFGDLSKYIIRDTREFTLLRLDEIAARNHQVVFIAFTRNDGDLLDAGTNPVKFATAAV